MARRVLILGLSALWAAAGISSATADESEPEPSPFEMSPSQQPDRRAPWKRRRRAHVVVAAPQNGVNAKPAAGALTPRDLRQLAFRPLWTDVRALDAWPPEPAAPTRLDARHFSKALRTLCPAHLPAIDVHRYAEWILRYAQAFDVDPTLLGALVYQQSRCDAERRNSYGVGLTMIHPAMHGRALDKGVYRYRTLQGDTWAPRRLRMDAFSFSRRSLREPETNLYFAAGFLRVFQEQCPDIDPMFRSSPHRHAISHFVWGDHVARTGPENEILTARRRLLAYYSPTPQRPAHHHRGVPLSSPLDGSPRLLISGIGDVRDNGQRRHAGIDLAAAVGEPVRSVAAGKVTFAGVDQRSRLINLLAHRALSVPRTLMGPRGLLVIVDHGPGVESLYAHLLSYVVQRGQQVQAGQLLGHVGRTGMRSSDAHLHLGLLQDGRTVDPLPHMRPYVIVTRAVRNRQQGSRAHRAPSRPLRQHARSAPAIHGG